MLRADFAAPPPWGVVRRAARRARACSIAAETRGLRHVNTEISPIIRGIGR